MTLSELEKRAHLGVTDARYADEAHTAISELAEWAAESESMAQQNALQYEKLIAKYDALAEAGRAGGHGSGITCSEIEAIAMKRGSEIERLASWIFAHPELNEPQEGNAVDAAIRVMARCAAPLPAETREERAERLYTRWNLPFGEDYLPYSYTLWNNLGKETKQRWLAVADAATEMGRSQRGDGVTSAVTANAGSPSPAQPKAGVDAEKVSRAILMLKERYGSNFPESVAEKAISLLEDALRGKP